MMYDNIRTGVKSLQKSQFINWFVTKTSNIKINEQKKLNKSLEQLFIKFDEDNSKIIDKDEFTNNFWWIEVFFEGFYQFKLMDENDSGSISYSEFKIHSNDL